MNKLIFSVFRQTQLCDVTLEAGGLDVPAHKAILSACSTYFYAMFTGDLTESTAARVPLKDIDGRTLVQLIDFIYTTEIHITEDNVQVMFIY